MIYGVITFLMWMHQLVHSINGSWSKGSKVLWCSGFQPVEVICTTNASEVFDFSHVHFTLLISLMEIFLFVGTAKNFEYKYSSYFLL